MSGDVIGQPRVKIRSQDAKGSHERLMKEEDGTGIVGYRGNEAMCKAVDVLLLKLLTIVELGICGL
jgi:hypothetical protein